MKVEIIKFYIIILKNIQMQILIKSSLISIQNRSINKSNPHFQKEDSKNNYPFTPNNLFHYKII